MPERLTLPVIPLRDTVLFPTVATPITAGRLKTLRAVEVALRAEGEDKRVFAVAQRDTAEEPAAEGLYTVGVIARVTQVQRFGTGLQLVLACESRATRAPVHRAGRCHPRRRRDPRRRSAEAGRGRGDQPLVREVREQALAYGRRRGAPEEVLRQFIGSIEEPGALASHIASTWT